MLSFLAVLVSYLPLAGQAGDQPPGLRLDGTFIQYQPWMMQMSPEAWRKELDAMRRAGMRCIILQWLVRGNTSFIPLQEGSTDATELILTEADRHGMEVFVGLATDESWWKRWNEPAYLQELGERNVQLAERAWRRYGHHESFAGWYLPPELHDGDFSDPSIDAMKAFFQRIAAKCTTLSGGKPVAIAPFFNGRAGPDVIRRVYERLLTDSGIDILMLQDGVGANGWDDDVAGHVVPAFRAFRDACLTAGVELWSDLECFRLASKATSKPDAKGFVPATAQRIAAQLAAEAPFVRRFVTFDFFHYMSPHRGADQKRLYEQYLKEFVDRDFFPILGRSTEVDPPGFSWYHDRSPESIASEIRAAGYSVVLYLVTADSMLDPALVAVFHREKIGVWYCTFGNGTYSRKDLPAGWEAWRMVTRSDLEGKPLKDGFTRLCLNNADYRTFRKTQIAKALQRAPVEGVQIMESHWPEYPGIESPAYACFCEACRGAFQSMFPGESALPDILNPASPLSPSKNPRLWSRWLEFRRRSLTGFLDDLVNSPSGIRRSAPSAKVCTWTLALAGQDGVRDVLEDSGEDALEVARIVRPDLHCFQTHWPDWIRQDLPPDYVTRYRPFIDPLRAALPDLPLSIQADTGSQPQNRRSRDWIRAFERASASVGASSTTFYEYFISGFIYTDAPRITDVRTGEKGVELHFSKRVDPAVAGRPDSYTISPGRIASARVDGSIVHLALEGVSRGQRCTLTARAIRDEPARRLFQDKPPAILEEQTVRFALRSGSDGVAPPSRR